MNPHEIPLPAGILTNPAMQPVSILLGLEGPASDADSNVFFSDVVGNRIMRLAPDGEITVFRMDSGRANGNVFDAEGRLITCEGGEAGPGGRRRIVRTDMKTGEVTVLTERYEGKRYNSPNDITVDSKGHIYFTDPRYGHDRSDLEMDIEGVYRIDLDGSVTRILGQPTIQKPNGLAVSPDDRTLYLIDSNLAEGGNRKVWAFTLMDDGTPADQRVVYDFAPGWGGDGMELDRDGNLYVCAGSLLARSPHDGAQYPPGVYVITPSGEMLGRIPIPEGSLTNCCFGGPDLKTLYVVAARAVYWGRVNVPGYHVYPPPVPDGEGRAPQLPGIARRHFHGWSA